MSWSKRIETSVHYRTLYLTGGHKIEAHGRTNVMTIIPALLPKQVPPDKPTTRARRVNLEVLAYIHQSVGIVGIPPNAENSDDKKEHAKEIAEALADPDRQRESIIPVEDFCAQHLERLDQFVSNSFQESAKLLHTLV